MRKTPFYNGDIVCDLALSSKLFELNHRAERAFKNKFGRNIVEDILVFKPFNSASNTDTIAREIAAKHLKKASGYVSSEAAFDLENAIENIDKVKPSPIFHYN